MHAWLSSRDVAEELRLHLPSGQPNTRLVNQMAARGELPGTKVGRWWRFRRDLLDEWLERRTNPDVMQRPPAAVAARRRSR